MWRHQLEPINASQIVTGFLISCGVEPTQTRAGHWIISISPALTPFNTSQDIRSTCRLVARVTGVVVLCGINISTCGARNHAHEQVSLRHLASVVVMAGGSSWQFAWNA